MNVLIGHYGIVYTINSIGINNYNFADIPVWFILRNIVQCKNIYKVIEKVDIRDCVSTFSLNIAASKNNKAFSIEKVLDKLYIIEIEEKYIHTNRIIHLNIDKMLMFNINLH